MFDQIRLLSFSNVSQEGENKLYGTISKQQALSFTKIYYETRSISETLLNNLPLLPFDYASLTKQN